VLSQAGAALSAVKVAGLDREWPSPVLKRNASLINYWPHLQLAASLLQRRRRYYRRHRAAQSHRLLMIIVPQVRVYFPCRPSFRNTSWIVADRSTEQEPEPEGGGLSPTV
jgi:hypothetical protein